MSWTRYGFGVSWIEVVFNLILIFATLDIGWRIFDRRRR